MGIPARNEENSLYIGKYEPHETHVSRDSHYGTLYWSWPVLFSANRETKSLKSEHSVSWHCTHTIALHNERNIRLF